MNKMLWAALAACMVVSGCASGPSAADISKDQARADEIRAKQEKERLEADQKMAQKKIDATPEWVINPPRPDAGGFYGVGIASSSNMDIALKKGMLAAEFELAKQYRSIVSGNARQFQRDDGGRSGASERFTQLVDQLVDRVELSGYEVAKREVKALDGQFQTYVLLRLSYERLERSVQAARAGERDRGIDEQFAELERRLDKFRDERKASVAQGAAALSAAEPTGAGTKQQNSVKLQIEAQSAK